MTEDKIKMLLKDINEMRQKLKGIKTDMKHEEKIDTNEYLDLKKAYKDLKDQVKEMEDDNKQDLASDSHYNQLREMKMDYEEKIANAREKLFENIAKLPKQAFEIDVETEDGRIKMQALPDMRVFLNGKEEKKGL